RMRSPEFLHLGDTNLSSTTCPQRALPGETSMTATRPAQSTWLRWRIGHVHQESSVSSYSRDADFSHSGSTSSAAADCGPFRQVALPPIFRVNPATIFRSRASLRSKWTHALLSQGK